MTDLRQAAQQALEALQELDGLDTETECVTIDVGDVIAALRTALEQQAEPVAETYIHEYRNQPHPNDFGIPKGHWWKAKQYADALYTTLPQRQWVGLTGQEKDMIARVSVDVFEAMYRVEAKLKEKNSD